MLSLTVNDTDGMAYTWDTEYLPAGIQNGKDYVHGKRMIRNHDF